MPRGPKIPVYRHHKPTGQASVRLDGKDHYLGLHGSPVSRERYERLIAGWLAGRAALTPSAPAAPSVGASVNEVLLAYWTHAEGYYRGPDGPTHELANIRDALKPVRRMFGMTPARDFGPLALDDVRSAMVRSGLARPTINARVHRIRRAFRWAASRQLVPGSLVQDLDTLAALAKGRTKAPEPRPVEPVAVDVVEATLPFLPRPVAAMVMLQLLSGMRAGEVMAMRSGDLTPGDPTWVYRPGWHKGSWRDRDRLIVLGPKAQEVLKPFLRTDLAAYLFDPRDVVAAHHAARTAGRKSKPTPSELRKRAKLPGEARCPRYDRRTYHQAIVRACDKAFPHPTLEKVPRRKLTDEQRAELKAWRKAHRWSPLRLRHAAATAIRARYGLEAAQVCLGHAKADSTEIYAERDLSKARAIMAEVG